MTTTYYFDCLFLDLTGIAVAPSGTPTINILNVATGTLLITAGSVTKQANMPGVCTYSYDGADSLHLIGLVHSTDVTLSNRDQALVPNLSVLTMTNLNGTISGLGARLPTALTTNGYMKSSLLEIISTALTEGATGRIAAAWQAFWNVTSPVATAQSVNQTGDSYARLGAPAVTVSADIAAVNAKTTNLPPDPADASDIAALFSAIPAAVWNRLISALTTSGSIGKLIVDNLNATISSRATPDDVTVSLAVSATEVATVATGRLSIVAGYTFRQTITSTSMDDLSAATKLWLSIKLGANLADSASQIFIEKTAGLTVVAGATYATVAHGSLTVGGSAGAWTIDIFIHDIATALLFGIGSDLRVAGLKYTKAGAAADDLSAWDGSAVITDGIVRAVS